MHSSSIMGGRNVVEATSNSCMESRLGDPMEASSVCNPSGDLFSTQPSAPANRLPLQQVFQAQNLINQECSAFSMPLMPCAATVPAWRCLHNNIVLPPVAPEMLTSEESCCNICIQWPTVVHASAYVVELLDQNAMVAQR